MRISNKAYQLVRNKYLSKGETISDEGCIAFRETIIKDSEHQYSIYEEYYDDEFYVTISKDEDIIEEYEVRI